MPGDPNSIGYTVFVSSRSGSSKDVQWELERAEKMKWIMLCGVGGVDDLCLDGFLHVYLVLISLICCSDLAVWKCLNSGEMCSV